jgi:hypothetical protein
MLSGMTTNAIKAKRKILAIDRISLSNSTIPNEEAIKATIRKMAINRSSAIHFNMAMYF